MPASATTAAAAPPPQPPPQPPPPPPLPPPPPSSPPSQLPCSPSEMLEKVWRCNLKSHSHSLIQPTTCDSKHERDTFIFSPAFYSRFFFVFFFYRLSRWRRRPGNYRPLHLMLLLSIFLTSFPQLFPSQFSIPPSSLTLFVQKPTKMEAVLRQVRVSYDLGLSCLRRAVPPFVPFYSSSSPSPFLPQPTVLHADATHSHSIFHSQPRAKKTFQPLFKKSLCSKNLAEINLHRGWRKAKI